MTRALESLLLLTCALFFTAGCGLDPPETDGSDPLDTDDGVGCSDAVPCADQSVEGMNLKSWASDSFLSCESDEGGGFQCMVDARAMEPPFVYARFAESGLEQVHISDTESLCSLDWDIAFHQTWIRVNSGVSGPGSVTVAEVPEGAGLAYYESLTEAPAGLAFQQEAYLDDECSFVNETLESGQERLVTALRDYYTHSTCVSMTGAVFILRLPDGRHAKLTITSYYDPENQAQCDGDGSITVYPPARYGDIHLRYALLP